MSKKNKDFYVWTMAECIKSIYENWGHDLMSFYSNIQNDFPNAAEAIHKIYTDFNDGYDCYKADALTFEKVEYVYEAIANLIPKHNKLKYNSFTKEQTKEYSCLNVCPWRCWVSIERIDLIIAVLLFTEEFILQPISNKNVFLMDTKLIVYGNFVTLKVSKYEEKTYVSIRIRNVMLLQYVVLN